MTISAVKSFKATSLMAELQLSFSRSLAVNPKTSTRKDCHNLQVLEFQCLSGKATALSTFQKGESPHRPNVTCSCQKRHSGRTREQRSQRPPEGKLPQQGDSCGSLLPLAEVVSKHAPNNPSKTSGSATSKIVAIFPQSDR